MNRFSGGVKPCIQSNITEYLRILDSVCFFCLLAVIAWDAFNLVIALRRSFPRGLLTQVSCSLQWGHSTGEEETTKPTTPFPHTPQSPLCREE